MFSRPKFLFLVSLLFVALLNPKFNPYLLFKFLIFYHSSKLYMYSHVSMCTAVSQSLDEPKTSYYKITVHTTCINDLMLD